MMLSSAFLSGNFNKYPPVVSISFSCIALILPAVHKCALGRTAGHTSIFIHHPAPFIKKNVQKMHIFSASCNNNKKAAEQRREV